MGNELKPCPFCRSSDLVDVSEGPRDTGPFYIGCTRCGARGPETYNGRDASAELWNKALRRAEAVDLPRDADGVPIRVGGTVYSAKVESELHVEELCWRGEYWDVRAEEVGGCIRTLFPSDLTRIKPDSLEAIENDMSRLVSSGYLDDPKGEARAIVDRIRRLREAGE